MEVFQFTALPPNTYVRLNRNSRELCFLRKKTHIQSSVLKARLATESYQSPKRKALLFMGTIKVSKLWKIPQVVRVKGRYFSAGT